MHRSRCFFLHILIKEIEQGQQWQNVAWKHNLSLLQLFLNYSELAGLESVYLLSDLSYIELNWYEQFGHQKICKTVINYFNTWLIGQEQLQKWTKIFSSLNMQGCWCFWPCHCYVKLPISMCTSKQKPSECEFRALL